MSEKANLKNITRDTLLNSITPKTTVITVNRRLANDLQQEFDSLETIKGSRAWLSPDILPLNAWIERCWQQCDDPRIVLNSFQEQLIWEEIIRDSSWGNTLLQVSGTAKSAKQAWQLLQQWNLSVEVLQNYNHADSQALIAWTKQFLKVCEQQGWISTDSLPNLLRTGLENKKIQLPEKIIFCGFTRIYPQIEKLISHINQYLIVEFLSYSETLNIPSKHQAKDLTAELRTMAQWAKQQLLVNKNAKIACIVPDLTQHRDIIERILLHTFDNKEFFNISLGKTLTIFPLIKAAFQALRLLIGEIDLSLLSAHLSSPFFVGSDQEFSTRAVLDKKFHENGELQISLRETLALASQAETAYCNPIWATRIRSLLLVQNTMPKTAPITNWLNYFTQILQILGWPGERSLNSEEYQTWQRWQSMLTEYASLELLNLNISYQQALTTFEKLANSIVFQPQTSAAPVQILGVLEASGLEFDCLWVQGLHDETWPAPLTPNPFLPIQLQRELNMPRASAQYEHEYHKNWLLTFTKSAKQVIFSYSQSDGDRTLRPSPLLKDISVLSPDELFVSTFQSLSQQIFSSRQVEIYQDELAPVWHTHEGIRGGSQILQYQAACPFKAFAKLRLVAETIPEIQMGLSASERGMLVHDVLARLWNKVVDQQKLLGYSEFELESLIANTVKEALSRFTTTRPRLAKTNFMAIEQQRLQQMMTAWFQLEKTRPPFKVHANEAEQTLSLAGLEIRLRVDRVDQLEDGSYLILDYKTGQRASSYDWFGERPVEPQLPSYYLLLDKPISGLAFAQIKPNQVRFNGLTIKPDLLPDAITLDEIADSAVPQNWSELKQYWHANLTTLAENFRAGHAAVDPKEGKTTCQYCDLQTLCRVHEVY